MPNNDNQRIIGTLKLKGWTDAEIKSYNKLHANSFELLGLLSPSEIIRAITVRYVSISLDLFIEENKMAMDVLTSLWTMLIDKELFFLKSEIFNDDFIRDKLKYNLRAFKEELDGREQLGFYEQVIPDFIGNRFTDSHVKDILFVIRDVLKPQIKYFEEIEFT
jgi:hypothetical protein